MLKEQTTKKKLYVASEISIDTIPDGNCCSICGQPLDGEDE